MAEILTVGATIACIILAVVWFIGWIEDLTRRRE